MKRTTIMADEQILERLREIAQQEDVSLAEVIRDALRMRAEGRQRAPSFIGAFDEPWEDDSGHPTAAEMGDWIPEPPPWR